MILSLLLSPLTPFPLICTVIDRCVAYVFSCPVYPDLYCDSPLRCLCLPLSLSSRVSEAADHFSEEEDAAGSDEATASIQRAPGATAATGAAVTGAAAVAAQAAAAGAPATANVAAAVARAVGRKRAAESESERDEASSKRQRDPRGGHGKRS